MWIFPAATSILPVLSQAALSRSFPAAAGRVLGAARAGGRRDQRTADGATGGDGGVVSGDGDGD